MRTYYSLLMAALLGWFSYEQAYFGLLIGTVILSFTLGLKYLPHQVSRLDIFHVLIALSLAVLIWDWQFFGNAALILFWSSILPMLVYDSFLRRA